MSQKRLGEALKHYLEREWAPQAVSDAERGKRQFDAAELLALSAVLRQPVAWFLTPESSEQIQMPGGAVVEQKDLFGLAPGAPDSAQASLALSEQVEESLMLARSVVRELENIRKAGGVLSVLSPERRTRGSRAGRSPDKQRRPS